MLGGRGKKGGEPRSDEERIIGTNRAAFARYEILRRLEAGISLTGTEVKSLRARRLALRDGYGHLRDREIYLVGVRIDEYDKGNRANHDPVRARKLLLHRREIDRLKRLTINAYPFDWRSPTNSLVLSAVLSFAGYAQTLKDVFDAVESFAPRLIP